jgi:signal transduction histidine kinase
MFVARGSFSVRLPEFVRTTTFRWTLVISGAFTLCILLMFGFLAWQMASDITTDFAILNDDHMTTIAAERPEVRIRRLEDYLRDDPRRVKLGGLFDGNGNRIAGNIESVPPGFDPVAGALQVSVVRIDAFGREQMSARLVVRQLADGGTLVIGRNIYDLTRVLGIVERALALGLIPALCLSLAAGAILSIRAQRRIEEVNRKIQRIVAGELKERLPTQSTNDPFDRLAGLVNGMLDEIETLVRSIAGVGDDIAHDLRTPLTRVRVCLERARQNATTLDQFRAAVDQAIAGLDQSLTIITALLRIAEIEHGRRLAGFGDVALAELVREVGELYDPIAEDKKILFIVTAKEDATVHGDRDLLFEAVANLVDNAVKFTPEGGRVELSLFRTAEEAVVRICDTGPGIAAGEVDLVARRFYRSDRSRRDPGLGLGLSLVCAIVNLHGFRFAISPGPSCVAEISGQRAIA